MNAYPISFGFLALASLELFGGTADPSTLHATLESRRVYQLSSVPSCYPDRQNSSASYIIARNSG